jgi:ATP-binding cassette subfamily B protein
MKKKAELFIESLRLVWKSTPYWTSVNVMISLARSFLPLALLYFIKSLIDNITRTSGMPGIDPAGSVTGMIIAVVVIFFLDEISADAGIYVRKKQSLKLEAYMYSLLHKKSVGIDLINFERPEYFDCLSRASSEAPWRPNSILNNLVAMFRGSVSLVLMAVVLSTLQWTLALLLIVVNIPGIWLRLHYADILYNFRRNQTPEARKAAYFNWLLTGDRPARELRLFGLGNYFTSLFRKSFLKQKEEELTILKKRTTIEVVSGLFKAAAILISLVYISGKTIKGELSLGEMAMFLLAFRQGMVYLKDLFGSLAGLYEDSLFIGDTFEFLNLPENIDAKEPVIKPSELKTSIIVDNLSFSYPGNSSLTLKNISFEIKKGEIVALAGANGAGKSTLVRLLCRLYDPDSGSIRFDCHDIKNIDPAEYRKLYSVIFQDYMLYNISAGENIRLGNIDKEHDNARIITAAQKSEVHKLLNGLPKGYDTIIGNLFEESRELSWGEWQKIALARALYRDAPVLILDEPSSALDAETEYEIFSRFREMVKGRTSILISHRLSNIALADRIIILDKGMVAGIGTHDELMKNNRIYYNMYTKQSSRFKL